MKSMLSPALFFAVALAAGPLALAKDAPALPAPPTGVVQFSHGKVEAIFAKGGPILLNTAYKVQAGRRVTSGTVEIHAYDTDIFYIVGGTATFVTGGTAVGQTNAGPGEDRAESITGGSERQLAKGDVIVIPKGIPHQFTKVDSPFTYFVVKVKE